MDAIGSYGDKASDLESTINVSGRYSFQERAAKLILMDVVRKLSLDSSDSLLDIGCNVGDITIPISFICKKVTGIDGEKVIERTRSRTKEIKNIDYLVGEFLSLCIPEQYECVLAYSVLHYVPTFEKQVEFVMKMASCLKPGGRALIGDIPNVSLKARFSASNEGKIVDEHYKENMNNLTAEDQYLLNSEQMSGKTLNDEDIMRIMLELRTAGYEAYLLPQRHDLPFGCTREDILIRRWD